MVGALEFKESLPDGCPPEEAVDEALDNVCRFLPYTPPDDEKNYLSHAELDKPTGNATLCKARSCSLFYYTSVAQQAAKIGRFKRMKVAVLSFPTGSGMHMHGRSGHIDFWVAANVDPTDYVKHVCDSVFDVEELVEDAG